MLLTIFKLHEIANCLKEKVVLH